MDTYIKTIKHGIGIDHLLDQMKKLNIKIQP
jgi:hypothetical protein